MRTRHPVPTLRPTGVAAGLVLLLLTAFLTACQQTTLSQGTTGDKPGPAPCDPKRLPQEAPRGIASTVNPLPATEANLSAGRELYEGTARPIACTECHGSRGRGDGPIGRYLSPRPTNLTCENVVADRSDGQLFWTIRNGSNFLEASTIPAATSAKRPGRRPAGTAMRPHRYFLTETETWQLVLYLRALGQKPQPPGG